MADEAEGKSEKRQQRYINRLIDEKFNSVAVERDEVNEYWASASGRGSWFIGLLIVVVAAVFVLVGTGVL